jgi:hypothetical protein
VTTPINLTQLRERLENEFGPAEYISWDEEPDYFQVYSDKGTICTTDNATDAELIANTLRAAFALLDTAEAATALEANLVDGGPDVGYADIIDGHYVKRLRETLNQYTTTP